jgi:hypothetical protein
LPDVSLGSALAAALCDLVILETFPNYRVRCERRSVPGLQVDMQVKAGMKDELYGILPAPLNGMPYFFFCGLSVF